MKTMEPLCVKWHLSDGYAAAETECYNGLEIGNRTIDDGTGGEKENIKKIYQNIDLTNFIGSFCALVFYKNESKESEMTGRYIDVYFTKSEREGEDIYESNI